jgi:hypothetical protein
MEGIYFLERGEIGDKSFSYVRLKILDELFYFGIHDDWDIELGFFSIQTIAKDLWVEIKKRFIADGKLQGLRRWFFSMRRSNKRGSSSGKNRSLFIRKSF